MSAPHQPDTDSPAIDAFLRGARLRRLQGSERRSAIRAVFAADMDAKADPFDPQSRPQRIMVMWRLARTTAIVAGLCAEDETLDASTELDPDPWTTPFLPIGAGTASAPLRRQRQSRLLRIMAEDGGLPLLPPRSDAPRLERWCSAATIIAADLGVERSREGLLGLQGLLDPHQCARCDISSAHVLAFEEMILVESLDLLLDKGERAACKHFKEHYGFSHKEAVGLLRVVKTQALERSASSIEEKRALMEMRYENMLGRYKETMDMDGELKASKELAKIQGLTRTEPENQAAEFFNVIKMVSARQDNELLDPTSLKLLDGQRVEEVEATTIEATPLPEDPDDAEALAEFDRENQAR
jgi:hypothetical protein